MDKLVPLTHKQIWILPGIALLLALTIFFSNSNLSLFFFFNGLHLYTGDFLWANATILGDSLVCFTLLLLFLKNRYDIIWALVVAALITSLWTHALKNFFDVLRPLGELGPEGVHVIGKELTRLAFPSGHTAAAFTLFGVIALLGQRSWIVLITLAVLAGIARMAVGAHWPLDVTVGAAGGWLSAVAGIWLSRQWQWGMTLIARRIIAVLLTLLALQLIFSHDSGYPQARAFEIIIALVSLATAAPALWQLFKPNKEKANHG